MANTRNAADYDGAVTALKAAGGDTSKLSSHERSLISSLASEHSSRANEARSLIQQHSRKS